MKVKAGSVWFRNKKLATLQNLDITLKSNDGQEVCDEGVFNTDGVATSMISAGVLIPVGGIGVDAIKAVLEHEDVDISVGIVDGKIMEFKDCRGQQVQITGEIASGKQTGKFDWQSGAPKLKTLA